MVIFAGFSLWLNLTSAVLEERQPVTSLMALCSVVVEGLDQSVGLNTGELDQHHWVILDTKSYDMSANHA